MVSGTQDPSAENRARQRLAELLRDQADVCSGQGSPLYGVLLARAAEDVLVLHRVPAYGGKGMGASGSDGPQRAVGEGADNRLHAQKDLLPWLLGRSG